MKAGIEWCAALCDFHVLEYFSTVSPNSIKQGLKWCAVFPYICVRVFFNSPTHPPMKQGLSDVLLFVITCVRVFSTVLPTPPMKQGLSDVLLFVITRVRVFFNSPTQFPPMKQDWVMCCSLWLHVWEISTVPPNSHLWAGLSDVLLFVITCLRVFFNSPPTPHL
jgi:hypothetical protein